jgi:mono/diheme cytochrome c family protein/glucose/arabinose dehydrogenase
MPRRVSRRLLPWLASACLACAQIGDKSDKPGEVQKPVVPAELIPPSPALSPADEQRTFRLAPGYRIELVASEPLVGHPVAAAFGPDGRLWVVEMKGYMTDLDGSREDQPQGRVVILSDPDDAGRFRRSTVFLDGLTLPRALALHREGALVGEPPNLWYARDRDGDGRADEKTLVAADFGVRVDPARPQLANPERAPNGLTWGHDGWLYVGAYTRRFHPDGEGWRSEPDDFRGQWGQTLDDFGRLYHNSNSDQLRVDLAPGHQLLRNPHLGGRLTGTNHKVAADQSVWPIRVNPGINRGYRPEMLRDHRLKEFTAACAPWIYRADLFPADAYGDAFVCEPAGNLIKRNRLVAEGGFVTATPVYAAAEFLASTDERFRPVGLLTGPEGALYVLDMYHGVIQHRISLTSYLRAQAEARGLVAPSGLGRIWRIVPEGKPVAAAPNLASLEAAGLVAALASPNAWRRETARRLLSERPCTDATIADLLRLATRGPEPLARAEAFRTLRALADSGERAAAVASVDLSAALVAGLRDASPVVRVAALEAAGERLARPEESALRATLRMALLTESQPEVLTALAVAGTAPRDPAFDDLTARMCLRSSAQPYLAEVFLGGLAGRELETLLGLLRTPGLADRPLVLALARCVLAERDPARVARLLASLAELPAEHRAAQLSLLAGLAGHPTVTARRPVLLPTEPPELARLASLGPGFPTAAGKLGKLLSWPGKPGVGAVAPLGNAEQRQFDAGKQVFAGLCAACHQPTGKGLEGLAPPLAGSEWVNGDPERLVRIVLHGLRGPITVQGRPYNYDMPAAGFLSDAQVAAVLTYVRREWDHEAAPVAESTVRAVRAATRGRTDAWTAPELERR